MPILRVGLAQINTTVGDIPGNIGRIAEYVERARDLAVDVVSFPELTVTGYPPEDLLLRAGFVQDNLEALREIARGCGGITAVVGFVDRGEQRAAEDVIEAYGTIAGPVGAPDVSGVPIYNAAAVIHDGRLVSVYHKHRLPNYGVYDEARYFEPDDKFHVYTVAGIDVGVNICEDIWYPGDPTEAQSRAGARVIVNINGSPYHAGKRLFRENQLLGVRAREYGVWVCYTNQVGGQDELVFDGGSMVLNPAGEVVARAAMFEEDLLICDIELPSRKPVGAAPASVTQHFLSDAPARAREALAPRLAPALEQEAEVYAALVLGTRDYLYKCGFQKALVALSGGIDSSLVGVIATDALGAGNVIGVSMPSRYSSEGSIKDAGELAAKLGIELVIIPIEPAHQAYLDMVEPAFARFGHPEAGVAEENIQSRIRGNIIMALSNKLGHLVLTTGNKSEFATGYTTLYGDMSGGFAVIKDVPKTLVYRLARYRNTIGKVVPDAVFAKAPSAELKPGQLDQDTLPAYEVLDPIIDAYVEDNLGIAEIVAQGFDRATVEKVVRMVNVSEYKRRQAPPGVKITPRAFGRDWRLPIANRHRGL